MSTKRRKPSNNGKLIRSIARAVAPLRSRQFSLLWIPGVLSDVGSQGHDVALIWLVTGLTGSSVLISLLLTIRYIPRILLQIFGGILVDHAGTMKTFGLSFWSDLLRAAVTFLLATLVTFHAISFATLAVFVIFYSVVQAIYAPAMVVLFAAVVPEKEYHASNALQQIGLRTAELLGPALGGYLIAQFSIGAAFTFDAATFLLSAIALLLIRQRAKARVEQKIQPEVERQPFKLKQEVLSGFRALWQEQQLFALVVVGSLSNGLNNVEAVLVPLLARFTLKLSAIEYGFFATCFGIGAIIGAFVIGMLPGTFRYRARIICLSNIVFGLTLFAMGTTQNVWELYGAYFLWGFSFSVYETNFSTLTLLLIPPQSRGRVFSIISMLAMGLNPLGFLLAGVLGGLLGVRGGTWAGGGAIALLSIIALFWLRMRRLDGQERR